MLRRFIGLARSGTAVGLFLTMTLLSPAVRGDDPTDPLPGANAGARTVSVIQGVKEGLLEMEACGDGEQAVRITLHNTSDRRLNVVFPPGLVAAASTSQPGGGFQSMGLGTPTANAGSFGEFRGGSNAEGFGSRPLSDTNKEPGVTLAASQTLEFEIPAVCLKFGLTTPNANNVFDLMDVEDYTQDARARKAMRSLATLGTSQKVAQAVAWHIFNEMSFPSLAARAGKILNAQELALAARFDQALESTSASDLVEPDQIRHSRMFVHVAGGEGLKSEVDRLARELNSQSLLGLPVRVVDEVPGDDIGPASIYVSLNLAPSQDGQTQGRLVVKAHGIPKGWQPVGVANFQMPTSIKKLDGEALASSLDRILSSTFVTIHAERRATGTTVFRVQNRLPMTVARLTVRAGRSDDAGLISIHGLGLGPIRAALTAIPASAAVVEHVELNGL